MSHYENCGYLSYEPSAMLGGWYMGVLERLNLHMAQAMSVPPGGALFCDRHRQGQDMASLRRCFDRAPLLVALFSPDYFESDACRAELDTMRAREAQLGLAPGSLIHAACLTDPSGLPEDVVGDVVGDGTRLDIADFSPFVFEGAPSEHADVIRRFDPVVQLFAADIAHHLSVMSETDALAYRAGFPALPEVPGQV